MTTPLITRLEEAARVADHDGYPVLVCPLLLREAAEALERQAAMLAASPQGEGSSAEAPMEAVAWRYRQTSQPEAWAVSLEDMSDWSNLTVQPLYTHPAPIKPSGDTGELREEIARIIRDTIDCDYDGTVFGHNKAADAILDLIQSERAGSSIGQNDQPGLAFSDAGEP